MRRLIKQNRDVLIRTEIVCDICYRFISQEGQDGSLDNIIKYRDKRICSRCVQEHIDPLFQPEQEAEVTRDPE